MELCKMVKDKNIMCLNFLKKKQKIKDIQDSTINQVAGDLKIVNNNGIQPDNLRQLVYEMVNSRLFELGISSKQRINERGKEYGESLLSGLSVPENEPLLQKFEDPKMWYVLRDSLEQYVRSGSQQDLEDQVAMLIDRLKVDEHAVERAVIEEAIVTLPKLSKPSVALLAAMRLRELVLNGSIFNILVGFHRQAKMYHELEGLTPVDVAYLRQKNCCMTFTSMKQYVSLEKLLLINYDLLFRHYGKPEDFESIMHEHPELDVVIDNQSLLVNYKNKYLFPQITQTMEVERLLPKEISEERRKAILDYMNNCPPFSEEEVRAFIVGVWPEWKYAFDIMDRENVQNMIITPLGAYIGQRFLEKNSGLTFPKFIESFNM